MDTYASLNTQTRRTNSTFQCHSPYELESLRLMAPRRRNSTHIRNKFKELRLEFSSVVIRFHARVNSTCSITPILEITQDQQ